MWSKALERYKPVLSAKINMEKRQSTYRLNLSILTLHFQKLPKNILFTTIFTDFRVKFYLSKFRTQILVFRANMEYGKNVDRFLTLAQLIQILPKTKNILIYPFKNTYSFYIFALGADLCILESEIDMIRIL